VGASPRPSHDGPHAAGPAPRDATPAPAPPLTRHCRARLELAAETSPARRATSRPPPDSSPCRLPPWARPPRASTPRRRPRLPPCLGPRRWRHGATTRTQGRSGLAPWARRRWGVRGGTSRDHTLGRGATPPSSSPGPGGRPPTSEGARPRWQRPVPRRVALSLVARCPPRGGRRSGRSTDLPGLVVSPAPVVPNAGAHLLPKAAAQRRLEAVRCSAWFGAVSVQGTTAA
jgi:hypothetical protein